MYLFLMQSNKSLTFTKFLKDICTKKRKTDVLMKIFLATNISELLSNQIPVKYKDLGCPTISCTIGQTAINHALLDLGVSTTYSLFQCTNNLGWTSLVWLKLRSNYLTGP